MDTDELTISALVGLTVTAIEGATCGSEEITFVVSDVKKFQLYHDQDCCESVSVEDICGDIADLIGSPILQAEESTNEESHPEGWNPEKDEDGDERYLDDSFTWTFYRLATIKGSVVIRWLGESNGYYSESVEFRRLLVERSQSDLQTQAE